MTITLDNLSETMTDAAAVVPVPKRRVIVSRATREALDARTLAEATEVSRKFGLAAFRWLTGGTPTMRFVAEQKADAFAYVLTDVIIPKGVVINFDPMRIAQDVRNRTQNTNHPFTAEEITRVMMERIETALKAASS